MFFGITHAARIFREQRDGGAIINSASITMLSGDGGPIIYFAAKAAVVSMTKGRSPECYQRAVLEQEPVPSKEVP